MCINNTFYYLIVCVFVSIAGCCTGLQHRVAAVWEVLALGSRFCRCWLCWWPTSTSSSSPTPQAPSSPRTSQKRLFLKPNRGSGAKQATSGTSATAKCRPDLCRLRANLNWTTRHLCLRMFNQTVISFFTPILCFPDYFYIMTGESNLPELQSREREEGWNEGGNLFWFCFLF